MNFFENTPNAPADEEFVEILKSENVKIERIVSYGHVTPADQWYNQDWNEWVMVLEGEAELEFADGTKQGMKKGDHVDLKAHEKHRVSFTVPNENTIWLAVHYR